ncbi:hypothetical protein L1889_18125 [Paenalcaligenes niemegkensis]|uniref:hypothetical protein n=1 Tax=Paenalcaligenes niemegkensis TaxID=2895469 RepID=UPI001EE9A969|nr:hypothetical protein [Paenalcaligenes niemegkensis]MCQ9618357.1 hypothetical protein [Paenalcaligenes niemegkensis]
MSSETFIPHPSCTVASGDCFVAARCIGKCQTCLPAYEANVELTEALRLLKELHEYTLMFRGMTGYVDGSGIDATVKRAGIFISRNRP